MSLEDSIRTIVREELERVLAAPSAPSADNWISLTELARRLGLSRPTVRALIKRGLPHIQPDRSYRFRLAECEAWIRGQRG